MSRLQVSCLHTLSLPHIDPVSTDSPYFRSARNPKMRVGPVGLGPNVSNPSSSSARPRTLGYRGIGHVGLRVVSLDKSQRFYDTILGLASEKGQPGTARLRCGSDTLVIYEESGGDSDFHFGFRLDSHRQVEEWKKWIVDNKITIIDDITEKGHPRSFKFRDPDGHLIEISSKR